MRDEFSVISLCGSDPRLQSPYGERKGDFLSIADVPAAGHRILYGPHVSLPAGHYRFELRFKLQCRGEGLVTVDLSRSGGHREFYLRRCFEWELKRGLIRISHALGAFTDAFELRLYAGKGFKACIERLQITTRTAA